jgi:uncharacterized protein YhjY with autotransporter beta-barrel domain
MKDREIKNSLKSARDVSTAHVKRFTDLKPRPWRQLMKITFLSGLIAFSTSPVAYAAQSLDQAVSEQLLTVSSNACDVLRAGIVTDQVAEFSPQLQVLCDNTGGGTTGGGGVSASGSVGTTQGISMVTQRMTDVREQNNLASLRKTKGKEKVILVASSGDLAMLLSTDAGHTSGLNLFIGGEYEQLKKDPTNLEDGYDSDDWRMTAGADYRFTDWFVAGLAVGLNRLSGDLDGGGDFETASRGQTAYVVMLPHPRAFAQATVGYAQKDHDRTRSASLHRTTQVFTSGDTFGDYSGDEFSAQFLTGYDQPIGRFGIGPRAGFSYLRSQMDGYQETGNFIIGELSAAPEFNVGGPTGLELAFAEDTKTSAQTILGVDTSATFHLGTAVVIPKISLDWRHEFEDDQRTINVHFVQDNRAAPQVFGFETEQPDRDFFTIGGGISALFNNGLQTSLSVRTLLGHDYFNSTTVSFGLGKAF